MRPSRAITSFLLLATALCVLLAAVPMGPSSTRTFPNLNEAVNRYWSEGEAVTVLGRLEPGDRPPMTLVYRENDTTPTNAAWCFKPRNDNGRVIASRPPTYYWTPEDFGAKGTGNPEDGDDGPAVRAAYEANGYQLHQPLRWYYIDLRNSPVTNGTLPIGLVWHVKPSNQIHRFLGPVIDGDGMRKTRFRFGGTNGLGWSWGSVTNTQFPHNWTPNGSGRGDEIIRWYYGAIKDCTFEQISTNYTTSDGVSHVGTNYLIGNNLDWAIFSFEFENVAFDGFNTVSNRPALVVNNCHNLTASGMYFEGQGITKHGMRIYNANQQDFGRDIFFHGLADDPVDSYECIADNAEGLRFNFQDQGRTRWGFRGLAAGNKGNQGPWDLFGYSEGSANPWSFDREPPIEIILTGSNVVASISSITGTTGPLGVQNWAQATISAPWSVYDGQFITVDGVSDTNYNGLVEVVAVASSTSFTFQLQGTNTWSVSGPSGTMVATQWLAHGTTPQAHRQSTRYTSTVSGASDSAYNKSLLVGYVPDPNTVILLLPTPFTDPNPTGSMLIQGDSQINGVHINASGFTGVAGHRNSSTNIERHFIRMNHVYGANLKASHVSTRSFRHIYVTNTSDFFTNAHVVTATFTTKGAHKYNVGDWLSWQVPPSGTYPGKVKVSSIPASNQVVVSYPAYKSINKGAVSEMVRAANFAFFLGPNTGNIEIDMRPDLDTQTSQHWYCNEATQPWFTRDRTVWNYQTVPTSDNRHVSIVNATSDSPAGTADVANNLTATIPFVAFSPAIKAWPLPIYPKTVILRHQLVVNRHGTNGRVVGEFSRVNQAGNVRRFTQIIPASTTPVPVGVAMQVVTNATGPDYSTNLFVTNIAYVASSNLFNTTYEETIEVPCDQETGHFRYKLFVTSGGGWDVNVAVFQIGAKY